MTTGAQFPAPGSAVLETYEEPAPDIVTFVWPQGQRSGIMHLEHKPGWNVRNYLRTQPLRRYPLLGLWKRCRRLNANKERIKLHYVPPPGDTIVLLRVR